MNPKCILVGALCAVLSGHAFAQEQGMDAALTSLADNLAGQIKAHGNKKVTVLDFTDLQGNYNELGRYVAEQLTVDLVMSKHDFAVLDRANLKQILAEHKLTARGLVDPDNAKKLGQFAGVDALILGTFVPTKQDVQLTAKIITTDTAEIIGAAKLNFTNSSETAQLLQNSVAPTSADTGGQEPPARDFDATKSSFDFGPLNVTLDSFRVLQNGQIAAILLFKNTDTNNAIRVALNHNSVGSAAISMIDDRGNQYENIRDLQGIAIRSTAGYWYNPSDTPEQLQAKQQERLRTEMVGAKSIEAGETAPVTVNFAIPPWLSPRQIGTAFRLQCQFTVATKGRYNQESFKEQTLMMEGIKPHTSNAQ
jgi:Curli production assembly/transport component CsgG